MKTTCNRCGWTGNHTDVVVINGAGHCPLCKTIDIETEE